MSTADGSEAIEDGEYLYRRIPASQGWYNPTDYPVLSPKSFRPRKDDTTGLSLYRAKYKSVQEVAKGWPGKVYYVAVLKAGDLRTRGIDVVPRPLPGDLGHCEIPGLIHETRDQDWSLEEQKCLAHELCLSVEGPF